MILVKHLSHIHIIIVEACLLTIEKINNNNITLYSYVNYAALHLFYQNNSHSLNYYT